MLRRIHLHGSLKKIHPEPIEVDTDTVAEAIRVISVQLPDFGPNALTGYKKIQVAGCDTVEALFDSNNHIEDVHIFPQFNGGKRGGFLQILIGAALVAASFIPGIGPVVSPLLLKVGAMLILGGILQMFSVPQRDTPGTPTGETNRSHYLGAPNNTVGIGTRIPILYGRRKVGGHILSINVSAV